MTSTLKQKTASGLFWGGFSNGIQQLIGGIFGFFMCRILNPDDYGLVGILAIFTAIASTIINSGFSIALTNKKDAKHEDYNAVFWFTVFMGLFLYIVLFFAAPLIANFYNKPELVNVSRILFISFLLGGIGTASHAILFKQLMVKQQAIIDIISFLTALSIGIVLAIKGFEYWALVIQAVIHVSLTSIIRIIVAPWRPTLQINLIPIKPMLSFGSKIFITSIFAQINNNFLSNIIGKIFSIEQVGIYSQGQKWANMGNQFVGGMINSITQPILVQVSNNKNRQTEVLRKLIRFGAFISFPMMLGLAFIGNEFLIIAGGGDKWLPSVPFLRLFCVWLSISYLVNLFTNVVYVHGKSDIFMKVTILTGLLQLVTVLCLYRFGFFTMVSGYVGISFAALFFWQRYVYKLIGLTIRDILKDILPYLGITITCLFTAWVLTIKIQNIYWLLVSKIVISAILYIFVMKISRSVIFKESVDFLMSFVRKKTNLN